MKGGDFKNLSKKIYLLMSLVSLRGWTASEVAIGLKIELNYLNYIFNHGSLASAASN